MNRRHPSRITKKQRRANLTMLLYGCRPERLAEMTAELLVGPSAKPSEIAEAERLLADARASRGAIA